MKKFFSLMLALIMAFSLVGCGAKEEVPDTVVKAFCEGMKKFDAEAMKTCVVDGSEVNMEDVSLDEETPPEISEYLVKLASEITYNITNSNVEGDAGTVTVQFSHADITPVMTAVMGEYITQAFAMAFAGASDEAMDALFTNLFKEKIESTETITAEKTIEFPCIKTDSGWKISEVPDDVVHVLTCNMATAFEGMDDVDGEESEETSEPTNFIEVPMNTEIELATIKVKVTDCIETTELTAEFFEPEVAQDGTKFIVYTVEIENLGKESMSFYDEDFALTDSQGRGYAVYDGGYWYYDRYVTYNEYAPNIKQSGNLVYHVPADCEGYYFALGKTGTSDAYMFMGK